MASDKREARPYQLTLRACDGDAIGFACGRYAWADALNPYLPAEDDEVTHYLTEAEAWEFTEAFEADTDGGHSPFPCLAPGSLRDRLTALWESVV